MSYFLKVGVRTEGLQEALLKNPSLIENVDRITKMKRVIKAVSAETDKSYRFTKILKIKMNTMIN